MQLLESRWKLGDSLTVSIRRPDHSFNIEELMARERNCAKIRYPLETVDIYVRPFNWIGKLIFDDYLTTT